MIGALPLEKILAQAARLEAVRKSELRPGDCLVVTTRNSRYSICTLGDGLYAVSGGWFDRQGLSPATTTITGCTWGGSTIKTDIVAGRGLFLEFGNRVRTTRIQQIHVLRATDDPPTV